MSSSAYTPYTDALQARRVRMPITSQADTPVVAAVITPISDRTSDKVLPVEIPARTLALLAREPYEVNLDTIPRTFREVSFGPRASSTTS